MTLLLVSKSDTRLQVIPTYTFVIFSNILNDLEGQILTLYYEWGKNV